MCIIVAVPENAAMPTVETLRECFMSNPDGAGFMYADGKRVNIRKGFMTFDEFMEALDEECIPDGSALVMHFRIATHGKVSAACCHPFPLTDDANAMRSPRAEARWGVAHNGIIQGRSTNDTWSDSMDFIAGVMAPLAHLHPSFMYSDDAKELLKGACKSKLAIMNHAGELMLVGEFVEDDGVFYSNTSYLPSRYGWTSYKSVWDRYDYDDYGYGWTSSWTSKSESSDAAWDDVAKLAEQLPYEACQLCTEAGECVLWEPECENERMAVKAAAYYSGDPEEEVAEVLGFDPDEIAACDELGEEQLSLPLAMPLA